jgi:hypothetical protein
VEEQITMFLMDLVLLVVFALALSGLLTLGFGWRHPARSHAVGASVGFLFLVLLFSMWASRAWFDPRGPALYGTPWLSLLLIGLLVSLLFLAVAAPVRSPRTAAEAVRQERDGAAAGTAFGLFFWLLLVALVGATLFGYYV